MEMSELLAQLLAAREMASGTLLGVYIALKRGDSERAIELLEQHEDIVKHDAVVVALESGSEDTQC